MPWKTKARGPENSGDSDGSPGEGVPGGREVMTLAAGPFLKILNRQPRWCPHSPAFLVPPGGTLPGTKVGL